MLHRVAALLLMFILAALPWPAAADGPAVFAGRTGSGAPVDLARLQGNVVLLFFWSTQCPVCIDKLPELRRNLEGWRGKPFVIVAVNTDRSAEDARAYERAVNATSPNAQFLVVWRQESDHRDSFGELPPQSPTTAVIDAGGKVVRLVRGRIAPEVWNDIAELLLNR